MTDLTDTQKIELKALIPQIVGRTDIIGSEKSGTVARWWIEAGFNSSTAPKWWDAGCFCPDSAKELDAADLTPSDAAIMAVSLHGDDNDTSIGYAHSNGDISTADAVRLAAVAS